tara:strand:- start:244 stop:1164 length:921 start_codon:yes stop_codon:yes gene_type:complete
MKIEEIKPSEYHTKLLLDRADVTAKTSWLSKSAIWEFIQGSAFKWRYHSKPFSPTAAMVHGTLVDTLVTAPEDFHEICVVSPFDSFRTDVAKEWRSRQLAAGRSIVTVEQITQAEMAADMLTIECKDSAEIIAESKSQVLLAITSEQLKAAGYDLGVNLKGLADFVPIKGDYLADLKTTADFTYQGFRRTAEKFGYAYQAALYLVIWNLTHPDDQRDRFKIIWQSSSAPYEVAVQEVSTADINFAKTKIKEAIERIVACAKADVWPMKYEGMKLKLVMSDWSKSEDIQLVGPVAELGELTEGGEDE